MSDGQNYTTNSEQHDVKSKKSNAKEIVLQWLTYSFWFWLLLIIGILLSSSLSYFLGDKKGDYTWSIYLLAPLLVLLPTATITDRFYKKSETIEKHGFSSVVMVVSAVVACLITVCSFITMFVSVIGLVIDTGGTSDETVVIISSLVAGSLSLLLFLRILYLENLLWVRSKFSVIVGVIFAVTLSLTTIGPLSREISRKSDRLVEKKYSAINDSIEKYVESEKQLPRSLSDIEFDPDAQEAIKAGNITYERLDSTDDTYSFDRDEKTDTPYYEYENNSSRNENTYKLCVVWKYEKSDDSGYDSGYTEEEKGYRSNYSHKKGLQCYTEKFYSYN